MKKITIIFFIGIIVTLMPSGCTKTDGDIGYWFGSWHLETILINGEEEASYSNNPEIMFSFQGNIFNAAYMERNEIYGSWSYAGEILTLIAGYNAGGGASNPNLFNPFPIAMHFPADVDQIEVTVTEINGKTMQWQYIDQNGDLLTYNFRKYP